MNSYADLQAKVALTADQSALAAGITVPEGVTLTWPYPGTSVCVLSVTQTRDGLRQAERAADLLDADATARVLALITGDRNETARRISLAERIDTVLPDGYVLTLSGFGQRAQARLTAPGGEWVDVELLTELATELGA